MESKPQIVVLGGGTGTFTVLTGLKEYPVDLSAVVSVADDGGSTGRLRSEYGVLPPGDICRCLVALSECSDVLRRTFDHRFENGSVHGHRLGNLILTALEEAVGGDRLAAVDAAHEMLRVRGRVIPVSAQEGNLCAVLRNGEMITGEHEIDQPEGRRSQIESCYLDPMISANPKAVTAILHADLVVFAPGDLYTSLIPVLLVDGIPAALYRTQGKVVYILGLTTKNGQTDGYGAMQFCKEVCHYLFPETLDAVLVNQAPPSQVLVEKYQEQGASLVTDDLGSSHPFEVHRTDLISNKSVARTPGDVLAAQRSLIRHDPEKLAKALLKLLPAGTFPEFFT